MATLVHYTYTVQLPGLMDWSAFLERVLPTLWIHDWDNGQMGPMEGTTWKAWVWNSSQWWGDVSYAIKACLGLWLALLGPMASPNVPNGSFNLPLASHLPPPPPPHSLVMGDILILYWYCFVFSDIRSIDLISKSRYFDTILHVIPTSFRWFIIIIIMAVFHIKSH